MAEEVDGSSYLEEEVAEEVDGSSHLEVEEEVVDGSSRHYADDGRNVHIRGYGKFLQNQTRNQLLP